MKTKIQIKNRFTGSIIFEHKCTTILECIKEALINRADLQGAYLRGAYLQGADLREVDLWGVDLWGADLQGADLWGADLQGAYLQEADLDFSCMSFHCNHLKPKTDRRLRTQLAFHLASWMKYADNLDEDEKVLLETLKPYANKFHRTDVERI